MNNKRITRLALSLVFLVYEAVLAYTIAEMTSKPYWLSFLFVTAVRIFIKIQVATARINEVHDRKLTEEVKLA